LTDCEVIAVNDGSTDGSRAILEEYRIAHSEMLTIVDKPNGGLSSARNAGVGKAMGDYLYFLDSDDYLRSHAIASIKQNIASSENADVIYLDCVVTNQGKRWGEHKEWTVPLMDFKSFFSYAYENKMGIAPNAVTYIYSNAYWRKAGLHFEEGIKYEDALFKFQLFVRDDGTIKVMHVEEPFYVYRVGREDSITTIITLKNLTDKQYIRKTADRLWKGMGIDDVSYYHMLYDSCTYMLFEAYKSGLVCQHRKFWDRDDVRIMRKGVSNEREYGFWFLAKLNPKWMARYYANELPAWRRRMTNVMLSYAATRYKKQIS
jgi:glycosyltransferase involved in cell wall biosynthesis